MTSSGKTILHSWLKEQLSGKWLASPKHHCYQRRAEAGLSLPITLPQELPPLCMLLIWDNLPGHYLVLWLFEGSIMPLSTPVGGAWLNMAESMQRLLVRWGLAGQNPQMPEQIIAFLEGVVGWKDNPTPF